MKEFYYNLKEGSRLFVSSDNDILLDFTPLRIEIRAIRHDGQTEFVDDLKRPDNLNVPAYFSADFKQFVMFDQSTCSTDKLSQRERGRQFSIFKIKSRAVVGMTRQANQLGSQN